MRGARPARVPRWIFSGRLGFSPRIPPSSGFFKCPFPLFLEGHREAHFLESSLYYLAETKCLGNSPASEKWSPHTRWRLAGAGALTAARRLPTPPQPCLAGGPEACWSERASWEERRGARFFVNGPALFSEWECTWKILYAV